MTSKSGPYSPGAIVFMGPNGTFGGNESRCVEFKSVAPPNREPHVVVRFDAPFRERSLDGSLHSMPREIDHLTIHSGLRTHLTGGRGRILRRVLHSAADDTHVHHLFAVGLPLPTCPIAPRDGQRVFQGAAFIPYGRADVPSRILIDVWGTNSHASLLAWRATNPAQAPVVGAYPANSVHGDRVHVFGATGSHAMWLEFTAWELPILDGEDPRPILIRVLCPHP